MPRTAPRRRAGGGRRTVHPPAAGSVERARAVAAPSLTPPATVNGTAVATVAVAPVVSTWPGFAHPPLAGPARWAVLLWAAVVAGGLTCLVLAVRPIGPGWLDGVGAVAVATSYTVALALRTGGRPVVFGVLALALGVATLLSDQAWLRTGAAVMTCVVAAVLAVMATVPAARFLGAARECVVALLIAGVGAFATVGFEPEVSLMRFEYATLTLALVGAFTLVHRLGAGLHGLGRRGLVGVAVGGVLLAVTLFYAEMLKRYGSPDVVDHLLAVVRWSRHHLGAFPRPVETVLGVPALAWGVHMRARRRQGWWLCAFGVAATTPAANSLVNPAISMRECGLSVLYGLVIGLVIGYVVVRIDLRLTGPRGSRGRRLEEAAAVRPEPPRTAPLL